MALQTANSKLMRRSWPLAFAATLLAGLVGLACQPSIGDRCNLSTDCSQRGDRLCDRSQGAAYRTRLDVDGGQEVLVGLPPSGGYCTIFNCVGNGCPDEAACVVAGGAVPGCGYTDRGVSRSARSFCLRTCEADSDCRADEGYKCKGIVRPGKPLGGADIEGIILDDDQSRRVCIYVGNEVLAPITSRPDAQVCQAAGPDIDAAAFAPDASGDASSDASSDAGSRDAAQDAGSTDAGSRDAATDGG